MVLVACSRMYLSESGTLACSKTIVSMALSYTATLSGDSAWGLYTLSTFLSSISVTNRTRCYRYRAHIFMLPILNIINSIKYEEKKFTNQTNAAEEKTFVYTIYCVKNMCFSSLSLAIWWLNDPQYSYSSYADNDRMVHTII